MTIKRVGVFSVGKVLGLVYAMLGLLFGALFSFLSLIGAMAGLAAESGAEAVIGALFGVGAIVVLPLMYGFFGFVFGMLGALIYNIVAGLAGGIEVEVEGS